MSASITLSGTGQYVLPGAKADGANPLQVWNTSGGNIYFTTTPGVTPTNSEGIITANGNITKPPGVTLYLCTDANVTAEFFYSTDGTGYTPGTTTTQAANAPKKIATYTLNWDAGINNTSVGTPGSPLIDVSAFSSIIVDVLIDVTGGTLTPTASNYLLFDVAFYDVPTRAIPASREYQPQFLLLNGVAYQLKQSCQVSVSHQFLSVFMFLIKAATPGFTGDVVVNVYGSNEVVSSPRYISQGGGMQGKVPIGGSYSRSTTVATTEFVASMSGPATFTGVCTAGAAGGAFSLSFADNGVIITDDFIGNPGAGAAIQHSMILPMRPVQIVAAPNPGATFVASLTQ